MKDSPSITDKLFSGWTTKQYVILVLLLAIVVNAFVYAFSHVEGPTDYGDDPNYLFLASSVVHGVFQIQPGYIFSVRLMSFMPIAFFYLLFGASNVTSTLWNIFSYIGIILVAFFAVRLIYKDDRAALITAFLVSVFPLVTQYAVNISEDVPLTFIVSLSVLLFVFAEKSGNRWHYFGSGAALVFAYLISYEASIAIIFLFLYALLHVYEKKIKIDKRSLFFIYGIALSFFIVFLFSFINSGMPFVTITTNLRFYSGIGQTVNGLPTIPTSNIDLWFYPRVMFQFNVLSTLLNGGGPIGGIEKILNNVFSTIAPFPYGVYFYLVVPFLALLLVLRDKKSYFFAAWFAFFWLFLEFGPMHVGVSLSPFDITYLFAHRLERFMMVLAVPLCAIIGIGLSRLLDFKNRYLLFAGCAVLLIVLAGLYYSNYVISSFWYYSNYYPQNITLQAANYLRPFVSSSTIYVEALYGQGAVSFFGANLQSYFGYPSDPTYYLVYSNSSCSMFPSTSYVVWSGAVPCSNFENVLNITPPTSIPPPIMTIVLPNLQLIPTNIYYVR